uniref:CDP-diacylglycerol--glycerol-3-phosphate 3-phosphatidyltransferase n=1 Tax=Albugo laibachii Nc14 TaxID=890382 RepID=F0WBW3_9STRA|nr:unnamed protein product [Albugo laibachii Nc14]|eukprot:CCA18642.1 unnamed protein product [Albugo laibachii Nc14]
MAQLKVAGASDKSLLPRKADTEKVDDEESAAVLDNVFAALASSNRRFQLVGDEITVLTSPRAFYECLLENISTAERRISMSSLYLGTGDLERKLVKCLHDRLGANPNLQAHIVLDYARAQRNGPTNSSVGLLLPLLEAFPRQVKLFLYRMPQLEGWKRMVPSPWNEIFGVSHSKVYVADNKVIISGANLSEEYFSNRQDRYIEINDIMEHNLVQFYHDLIALIASFSLSVKAEQTGQYRLYKQEKQLQEPSFQARLEELMKCDTQINSLTDRLAEERFMDTWAIPTFQFGPLGITQDEEVLLKLLSTLPAETELDIATGYLNLSPAFEKYLLECKPSLQVITAAPSANGFHRAKRIRATIPTTYSVIEKQFYEKLRGAASGSAKTLREYNRAGWTFHGKGMWITPVKLTSSSHEGSTSALTVCGSSNFGLRSFGRDMEAQLYIYTKNRKLCSSLEHEKTSTLAYTEVVADHIWDRPDRKLNSIFSWKQGKWIRPLVKYIRRFL